MVLLFLQVVGCVGTSLYMDHQSSQYLSHCADSDRMRLEHIFGQRYCVSVISDPGYCGGQAGPTRSCVWSGSRGDSVFGGLAISHDFLCVYLEVHWFRTLMLITFFLENASSNLLLIDDFT